jgi:hypothetical protein
MWFADSAQAGRDSTDEVGTVKHLNQPKNMTITSNSTTQSALQEAKETAAQTQAEAAKGDQQAVRKLAAEKAANQAQTPPPQVNTVDSSRGLLIAKA